MKTNSLNISNEQVPYTTADTCLYPPNALLLPYPILAVIEYPICKTLPKAGLGLLRHNLSKLQSVPNIFHYYYPYLHYSHVSPKQLQ
jgi:hypothetical protein